MSYVTRTLAPREHILFSTGYHWLYWVGVALLMAPFIAVAAVSIPYSVWDVILLAMLAIPFWFGLVRFIHGIALEVAVTSDRFVRKTGLIAIVTQEVSLVEIEKVNLEQSILGRLLGYGSIFVHGTGSGQIEVHMITDPAGLRREIQTARENIHTNEH
jgi:uncharacterized membrane protein YdbT with pleckstrin-like domain